MPKLLLIEGECQTLESPQSILESAGFEIERVGHPKIGLERLLTGEHSMAILQLSEPGGELDFIHALRAHSQIPVVVICAGSSEIDRILRSEEHTSELQSREN